MKFYYILAKKPTIWIPYNNDGNAFVRALTGKMKPALFRAGTTLSCPFTLLYDAAIYLLRIALCESP